MGYTPPKPRSSAAFIPLPLGRRRRHGPSRRTVRVPCPPAIKAADAGIPNLGACDVQPPVTQLTRPCFRKAYNRPVSGAGPPSAVVWFHTPP